MMHAAIAVLLMLQSAATRSPSAQPGNASAPGALLFATLQGAVAGAGRTTVRGRFSMEPVYAAPLPDTFTLVFVNESGRAVVSLDLNENVRGSSYTGSQGEVRLRSDGTFDLLVPRGEYRILLRRFPNPDAKPGANAIRYYVKSFRTGETDLENNTIVVGASFEGEIVITLAKCTPETRELCR